MTNNVTELRPILEHYESCDREVHGRAVLSMIPDLSFVSRAAIVDYVREWRSTNNCGCAKMRLGKVEADLAQAKLRWNASMTDANADVVADLTTRRNQLRGMM